MVRKSVYTILVVSLLLVTAAPANVALAQKPEPPDALALPDGLPAVDMENLPDALQKAAALQESLTPEQHAAVREILDNYQPEMQAISGGLMATGKVEFGAEPQRIDPDIAARMLALVESIEAEMAGVLGADQLALYQAVMQAPEFLGDDAAVPEVAVPTLGELGLAPAEVEGYTSYCFYGPLYGAYAKYYAWWGYVYAYYNYYYYGTTYGYYATLYAYYGWAYMWDALLYAADTYFFLYYTGMYQVTNSYPFPYWCYLYGYYAEYYLYYAYLYAYYDYYYGSGSSYAYYAYYYCLYGNNYAYYTYLYCYYCYYYL
jgi:hypothetical protein